MTISFSGLASGLDTSSWVESLTALKRAKVTTLETEKEQVALSQNTLNSIKSFFNSFRSMLEKVTDAKLGNVYSDVFAQNLANSSNVSALTASVTPNAEEKTYNIRIDKLATYSEVKSNYVTTIQHNTVAAEDSKLSTMGVNAGNISVNVNGISYGVSIGENETISSFIQKLSDIGVDASYNESSGVFSVNVSVSDIAEGTTNLIDSLHLTGVNEGYEGTILKTRAIETIYSSATSSTKLSAIATGKDMSYSITNSNKLVTYSANDTTYTYTLTNNTTVGSIIADLTSHNIYATIDATGTLTIDDIVIQDSGGGALLKNVLGLDVNIFNKTQTTSNLNHQTVTTTTTTATSATKLKDLGEGITVANNSTVIVEDSNKQSHTITVSGETTLGTLMDKLNEAGLYATIDNDGVMEISGGNITGGTFDAISALGLTEEPYTAMATGGRLTETIIVPEIVTLQTRLVEDLGVTRGYLEVTKPDDSIEYLKIYSGMRMSDLMADLADWGIHSSLDETSGILTITGGSFRTMSDAEVNSTPAITNYETDPNYLKGTNLLTCLYGEPEISLNQTNVSSVKSRSMALNHSVTEVVDATEDTTLGNLGLTAGTAVFDVDGETRSINVTAGDSISTLQTKLNSVGIASNFDSDTSRFSIENATITSTGTSNLNTVLDMSETVSNRYTASNTIYAKETVTIEATTSTKLKELGLSNSLSNSQRRVKLYNADGSVIATTTVTETTTLGDLVSFVNTNGAEYGMSASVTDGVFEIQGGYISNAKLTELMGLDYSNQSSYVLGSIVTVTTNDIATGNSTLSDIFANIGTSGTVEGAEGYTLNFNSGSISVSASTTINQLVYQINSAGGSAYLDSTGKLHIDGGTIDGTVADALGMVSNTHTIAVGATGEMIYTKETSYASYDTKLSDLGINSTKSFTVYDELGNGLATVSMSKTKTLGDFITSLGSYGIDATISDGVISMSSVNGKYITGTLATALGITTRTDTNTINMSSSSTLSVTHTASVTADINSKLGEIGAITNAATDRLVIYDENQTVLNTISTLTANTTVGELFEVLRQNGIQGTMIDGVISLYSSDGRYAGGSIMTNMGISATQLQGSATVAMTVTSSTITYNQKATESDKISDFVANWASKNKTITVTKSDASTVTTVLTNNTTFDELFGWMSVNGIDGSISNGYISLDPSNGEFATGEVLSALGITTVQATTTTTVGTVMSSSLTVTYTSHGIATTDSLVKDYVTLPSNKELVVKESGSNTAVGTYTVSNTTTFGDMMNGLASLGVESTLTDGVLTLFSTSDRYVTGAVLTTLGISTTAVSTTIGGTVTSAASVTYSVAVTDGDLLKSVVGSITANGTANKITVYNADGSERGSFTVDNTTTFGDLRNSFADLGMSSTLIDGRLAIFGEDGVYATGPVLTSLGMSVASSVTVTTTVGASVSSTLAVTYTSHGVATTDSLIKDYVTLPSNKKLVVYESGTNSAVGTYTVSSTTTFGDMMNGLASLGVESTLTDGVLTLFSTSDRYVTGAVLTTLGISTTAVSTTIGGTLTSSATVTYTTNVTDDDLLKSVVGSITANGTSNKITVYNADGSERGSFTVSNTTTFGDLRNSFADLGMSSTLIDGRLAIFGEDGVYATGPVLTSLGMSVASSVTVTTTVGASVSSTLAVTYTSHGVATTDSLIKDYVTLPSNKRLVVYESGTNSAVGTYTVSSTTTFGDMMNGLASLGVESTLTDGVLTLFSTSDRYVTGAVLTTLGISTTAVSTTIGGTLTSSATVTYTTNVTDDDLLKSVVGSITANGTANKITVYNADGSERGSFEVNNNTTFGDLRNSFADLGMSSTLIDGRLAIFGEDGVYATGPVLTSLGMSVASSALVTTTMGTTMSSTAAVTYTSHGIATTDSKVSDFVAWNELTEEDKVIGIINGVDDIMVGYAGFITVTNSMTFGQMMEGMASFGVESTLIDGVLTLTSSPVYDHAHALALRSDLENTYVLARLGISNVQRSTTTTIGGLMTSTASVTYTRTVSDTDLVKNAITSFSATATDNIVKVHNQDGTMRGSFTVTTTTTFGDLRNSLASLGMSSTLIDGRLAIFGEDGVYADGTVLTDSTKGLGMSVASSALVTTTVGATISSTLPVYQKTTAGIDENTSLCELLDDPLVRKYYTIVVTSTGSGNSRQIVVNCDFMSSGQTSLGDLCQQLYNTFGVLTTYSDGVLSFKSDEYILTDANPSDGFLSHLGYTTPTDTTITLGTQTTSTAPVTYTSLAIADMESKISDFITLGTGNELKIYVKDQDNSYVGTVTVGSTTTFGQLSGELSNYQIQAQLVNGYYALSSTIGNYVADAVASGVLSKLGISFVNADTTTTIGGVVSSDIGDSVDYDDDIFNTSHTNVNSYTALSAVTGQTLTGTARYKISTADELKSLADMVANGQVTSNNVTFYLANDIDISTKDITIGTEQNNFIAKFNGNNYVISGLEATSGSASKTGLFAYTDGATIENVIIKDANVQYVRDTTGQNMGLLVGTANNTTIKNCSVTGNLELENDKQNVGLLVGSATGGTITSCSVAGTVGTTGNEANVGGIAGSINGGTKITNCYADVEFASNSTQKQGGIAGSVSSGSIASCRTSVDISNAQRGGGIAGSIEYATIRSCVTTGSITGSFIGGLAGYAAQSNYIAANHINTRIGSNYRGGILVGAISDGVTTFITGANINKYDSNYVNCTSLIGQDVPGTNTATANDTVIASNTNSIQFVHDNKFYELNCNKLSIGNMCHYLNNHGILAFVDDGQLVMSGSEGSYIVNIGSSVKPLLNISTDNYYTTVREGTRYNTRSSQQTVSTTATMTTSSTFGELGLTTNRTVTIFADGTTRYITVHANDTVGDFISTLAGYEISGSVTGGKITLYGTENYMQSVHDDIRNCLGLNNNFYSTQKYTNYYVNQYALATIDTKFGDMYIYGGSAYAGNGTITVQRANGTTYNVFVNENSTLGDVINTLDGLGISVSSYSGYLTLQGTSEGWITSMSDNVRNILNLHAPGSGNTYNTTTATVNYSETTGSKSVTVSLTSGTTFSELGINSNNYTSVMVDGTTRIVTINGSNTVGDFLTALAGYGISGSIVNGTISLRGTEDHFITKMSDNLRNTLKLKNTYPTSTTSTYIGANTPSNLIEHDFSGVNITNDTLMGDIKSGTVAATGTISVQKQNGVTYTVSVKANDTVDDVIDALGSLGIYGSVNNGTLVLQGTDDGWITSMSNSIKNALKYSSTSAYSTTTATVNYSETTGSKSVTTSLTSATTLKDLSINSNQTINVHTTNGAHSITLNTSNTVGDMLTALAGYGISGVINNGNLTLTGGYDHYITGMSSDLASKIKINTNSITACQTTTSVIRNNPSSAQEHDFTGLNITEDTLMGDIKSGTTPATGTISVQTEGGQTYNINIAATDKVSDVIERLSGYGISSYVSGGQLHMQGTDNGWITSISNSISSALKLTSVGSGNSYTTTTATVNYSETTGSKSVTTSMTSDTSLSSLGISSNQKITVRSDGTQYIVTVNGSNTVGDIATALGGFGISGSFIGGKLVLKGGYDHYITGMSNTLATALGMGSVTFTANTTTTSVIRNNPSSAQEHDFTENITYDTKMGDIKSGTTPATGTISIQKQDGVTYNVNVAASDTVGDVIERLSGLGISSYITDGKLYLQGTDDGWITSIGTNLRNALKLDNAGNGKTYTTTTATATTNTTSDQKSHTVSMAMETTFAQLGLGENTVGTITVKTGGTAHTVSVSAANTLNDMATSLAGLGISAQINNGVLTLTGSSNAYIDGMTNLADILHVTVGSDHSYHIVASNDWVNSNSNTLVNNRNIKIDEDTVISSISGYSAGNGSLKVHKTDGTWTTISVNSSDTLGQFFTQISQYGLNGSIDSNGKVSITGIGDVYLDDVASGTNILSALKLSDFAANTKTDTVNSNSAQQFHTRTISADGTVTLEDLIHDDGSGITFTGNNVSIVVSTTSDGGNSIETITFSKTQTLYNVLDSLASKGILAEIDAAGRITMNSPTLTDFDVTGELADFLMGDYTKNYGVDTTSSVSQNLLATKINTLSDDMVLSDLGITAGNIKVKQQGIENIVSVDNSKTIGEFRNLLSQYGFNTSIDSQGRLSISAIGDSNVSSVAGGSNIVTKLGIGDWSTRELAQTSENLSDTKTTTVMQTSTERMLSDLTNASGTNLGITNGLIDIYQDGTRITFSVNNSDTLATFASKLSQHGISLSMGTDGKLYAQGDGNTYLANHVAQAGETSSNVLTQLGLAGEWTAQKDETSANLNYDVTNTVTATRSTKLSKLKGASGDDLNITEGTFYVYENGVRNTETITEDTTVGDLMSKLATYGLVADIAEDGSISVNGHNESYLAPTLFASGNSNVVETLFAEWNFTNVYSSNDLTIPTPVIEGITRDTKLSNIIEGSYTEGKVTVVKDGVQTDISLSASETVGSFIDQIEQFGFDGVITENGQVIVRSSGNSYLKTYTGEGASNVLSILGIDSSDWINTNNYESGSLDVTKTSTATAAASEDTRIADIAGVGNHYQGEFYIYNNGVKYSAYISTNETLGSLMETLRSFGLSTSLAESGSNSVLTIKGNGDSYVAASTSTSNASTAISALFQNAVQSNEYIGTEKTRSTETIYNNATEDTVLSDIQWAASRTNTESVRSIGTESFAGDIKINIDGQDNTIQVEANETMGSLLGKFRALGLEATISGGKIVIQSGYKTISIDSENSTSSLAKNTTDASDTKIGLKFNNDMGGYASSSDQVISTTYEDKSISTVKWADGDTQLSLLNVTEGTFSIYRNGVKATVNIEEGDVFSSNIVPTSSQPSNLQKKINDALQAKGATGDIVVSFDEQGYLKIYSSGGADVQSGASTDTSNFSSITGVISDGNGAVKSARELFCLNASTLITTNNVYRNTSKDATMIKAGTITVGTTNVTLASDTTVADAISQINTKLTSSGADAQAYWDDATNQILARTNSNPSISVGISGINTGITTGEFTVGNATIYVTETSTIDDIITQINTSDATGAKAYWDNLDGKLVIQARETGASYVNIESGTTNFTDVMGLTSTTRNNDKSISTTRMNIETQKVGENAKFTINGTSYTSSSNTIKEDVSRITGVTLNLKEASEGEIITLKIEKDKETAANAVSDVVDAYNELMENVDKAIATDGQLKDQSTLKFIRNQLRSLMTSAGGNSSIFRNLDSIGIGVKSATAGNISTSNSSIVTLSFDKEKFFNCFSANPLEVKSLLVGDNTNKGIFANIEDVVENALAGVTGYFDSQNSAYQKQIRNLTEKITKETQAVARYRERLEAKFSAMDMLIAQMQQQYSTFLKS